MLLKNSDLKNMKENYLTQEQVDNLKEGAKVIITWTGGNGPHEYTIYKRKYEGSFVKPYNPNSNDGEIDFVGKEKYHTRVKLLK